MHKSHHSAERTGFTLVEMLITLAVITILMGLLLTGLRSARSSARESQQLSNLRQLYMAWNTYATQNNESLLPGFLETDVQTAWKSKYRNSSGQVVSPDLCQTYPWRLSGYLDYSTELTLGYLDRPGQSFGESVYEPGPRPFTMPAALMPAETLAGSSASLQPEFGYNAFYLGGWWQMNGTTPQMRFVDAKNPTTGVPVYPVAKSIGSITRPDSMVAFSASTYSGPGTFKGGDEIASGSAWIVPSYLAQSQIWTLGEGGQDASAITVISSQAVPLRRFHAVPFAAADGSQRTSSYSEMRDMRFWTNISDLTGAARFQPVHTEN